MAAPRPPDSSPLALRICWYFQHRPANVAIWFSSLSEIKTDQELEENLLQEKTQKSESTTTMGAM